MLKVAFVAAAQMWKVLQNFSSFFFSPVPLLWCVSRWAELWKWGQVASCIVETMGKINGKILLLSLFQIISGFKCVTTLLGPPNVNKYKLSHLLLPWGQILWLLWEWCKCWEQCWHESTTAPSSPPQVDLS